MTMYTVIVYYKFAPVEDPREFCQRHKAQCQSLDLKGRIYISKEGVNGTAAGTAKQIAAYKNYLNAEPGFDGTDYKEDHWAEIPFDRLVVKVRKEIVTLRSPVQLDVNEEGSRYLNPKEWRDVLESDQEYQLIDVRNNYESAIGHFEGAILPDVKNFYDFPKWLDEARLDKEKKVLMYCTGGIRCEKFSVFMKKKGFKDVNQLRGGILRYAKEQGGKHYKGKCFVFDDRLAVQVNPEEQAEPLGRCYITGAACDEYINCANMDCNKLFLCSEEGARQMNGCCSEECRQSQWRRPFNPDNIYAPSRRWYNYHRDKSLRKESAHGH